MLDDRPHAVVVHVTGLAKPAEGLSRAPSAMGLLCCAFDQTPAHRLTVVVHTPT
ncbi:Uncharacterised protein [Mycobacteroides abscessus subsp. abscessus]|jgi:hypothetical protein|nr:Uncharacterised protein [Mycobacteroides abscessus subsp. abscessus]